jgi:hypothetical protein
MVVPIHVVPVNDLIEHATDGSDCPCGPEQVPVPRDDGSMGWLVSHHSLDGREFAERGESLPQES